MKGIKEKTEELQLKYASERMSTPYYFDKTKNVTQYSHGTYSDCPNYFSKSILLFEKARTYEKLKKYEKAIKDYSEVIMWEEAGTINPLLFVQALYCRGRLYYALKMYACALYDFRTALYVHHKELA